MEEVNDQAPIIGYFFFERNDIHADDFSTRYGSSPVEISHTDIFRHFDFYKNHGVLSSPTSHTVLPSATLETFRPSTLTLVLRQFSRSSAIPPLEVASHTDIVYDRGLVAWMQVIVAFLLVFNGFGYFSSFGVFQAYYETTLGRSASDISWVGSFQLFVLFAIGTISGRLMDAGYFRHLAVSGCTLQVIGVFSTSFSKQYWQLFLAQGVVQGLGNGLLFAPLITLVASYFNKRRAFALALAACGAPIGGIIFPLVARQLLPQIGFGWTVRVMGFLILFNTAVIVVLMRPRIAARAKAPWVDLTALRDLPHVIFAIGIFFVVEGLYFAYFYISTFGKDVLHLSSNTSLTLLMLTNSVGVTGRILPALLADRFFGPFNVLLPAVFLTTTTMFIWIGVSDLATMYAFICLYGFGANAIQTLFPTTITKMVSDPSRMGVRVGMVFTIISFACLTGPPIAGILITQGGGRYLHAQLFGGSMMLGGSVLLVIARLLQIRAAHATLQQ